MTTLNRPRQIIEFCLKPLDLDPASAGYREVYQRLDHVIKTLQQAVNRAENAAPVEVDFSKMPTLTINEAAHGNE